MTHDFIARHRAGRRPGRALVKLLATGAAVTVIATACGDLTTLKQENPGKFDAGTLYIPSNAQLLVFGAIADFECAFDRYVVGSGLLGDELITAIASTDNYDYERRTLQTNRSYGTGTCNGANQQPSIYTTLSVARATADTTLAKLEGWTDAEVPNRTKLMAQAATYAGYSLTLLGEGMCSAAINLGPELDSIQVLNEAKARFDKAIPLATTANDQATLNLATLGRARVLLDLGNVAAAGVDAAKIPSTFVANMTTDAVNARRQNFVWKHSQDAFYSSLDPSFRNVQLNGIPDPRILDTNLNRNGTAPNVQVWVTRKYRTATTPIPIAKYAEAQLIVAEAKAAAGDLSGAVTAINNARNTHNTSDFTMPQFDGTGLTAAQIKTQIIEERRRELFLEGHRLGDVRRYGLPLNPATGSTYTAGGGTYGSQSCFPLPDVERINNPNISG